MIFLHPGTIYQAIGEGIDYEITGPEDGGYFPIRWKRLNNRLNNEFNYGEFKTGTESRRMIESSRQIISTPPSAKIGTRYRTTNDTIKFYRIVNVEEESVTIQWRHKNILSINRQNVYQLYRHMVDYSWKYLEEKQRCCVCHQT